MFLSFVFYLQYLFSWTLGVIESICLTVTVGVSVDFAAHIAISYNHSHFKTRLGRIRTSMSELGVSVLSSAISTMLSALLLAFATVKFFNLFGQFILIVISLSALWAFVFLVAALLVIGPQNEQGDLLALYRKLKN